MPIFCQNLKDSSSSRFPNLYQTTTTDRPRLDRVGPSLILG